MTDRILVYAGAALLGLATMLLVMPLDALTGGGAGWWPPFPDQAQALTGHLAFQADDWRWPLLDTTRLFWPQPISIALVDANPLVSLAAKAWTRALGAAPINALGAFIGACMLLQPIAAAYAARGLGVRPGAALAAGVLAAASPALMNRMGHLNLCAHFLVLLALGLALRGLARRRGAWGQAAGVLVAAVLIHPYLFQLCAVVLAAIPLDALLRRRGVAAMEGEAWPRTAWRREALLYVGCGVLAVGVLTLLSGPIGGGEKGFVFFSMNLVSPVWPQRSGVFGADLPIVDATGGQYEGFNWMGAGVLLLLAASLAHAGWRRAWPRPAWGLACVLLGLFLISLSSRVYAGPVKLLDLGAKPWEDLFGSFRSPGRAFWPVGYAIMLGCVAVADRMGRRLGAALLVAAVALQVADIRPLLAAARDGWTHGSRIATPAIPAGTTLFSVAPFPGCTPALQTKSRASIMLLAAARMGARDGDVGLGRSPKWFSCERILSDALELPLLPGEARAFFEAATQAALRPALLGPGASCARSSDIVLCGREVAPIAGVALGGAIPPAPVTLAASVSGAALAGVLGSGWVLTPAGEAWSEGPRATLLVPVPSGSALVLTLRASGVAGTAGGTRAVGVSVGREAAASISLDDTASSDIRLPIPASATRDGILRVALDVVRPIDPAKRGLAAPVSRAAIRLTTVSLAPAPAPAS